MMIFAISLSIGFGLQKVPASVSGLGTEIQMLMTSGLILGSDTCWITFQSGYDFGYLLKKEFVKKMAKNPIIFACANPDPEILPEEIESFLEQVMSVNLS